MPFEPLPDEKEDHFEPLPEEKGDAHFEPIDHRSYVDRWKHSDELIAAAIKNGMKEGFGSDDPRSLGFEAGSENTRWMQQVGIFANPENPVPMDGIRLPMEGAIRVAAGVGDAAMRLVNGAVHAAGGAFGQILTEAGLPGGPAAKRELVNFANYMMIREANSPAPFERVIRGSDGVVRTEPIGTMPEKPDFTSVATAIEQRYKELGAPHFDYPVDRPGLADKLQSLYEEYGIHPNEVLADAVNDPTIMRSLASDDPRLPERYTGIEQPKPSGDELKDALQLSRAWPETPQIQEGMAPEPKKPLFTRLGDYVSSLIDRAPIGVQALIRDLQMKVTPMAERLADMNARAAAKDFANTKRVAVWEGQRIHDLLTKEFTPEQLRRMYEAVDAEDLAKMAGKKAPEGKGLASLEPREREVVEMLRTRMAETYKEAGELKMHRDQTSGKEFYVPRMIEAARGVTKPGEVPVGRIGEIGRNLFTSTQQLRRRLYKTAEETEAAAKKALGDDAFLVRDIRTLNLANMRLQEAISGRKLIDEVKTLNKELGQDAVVEGGPPANARDQYFTIDHPAFRVVKPDVKRGPDGRWMRATYEDGTPAWKTEPLYIHRDFEGPLRAVLTQSEGALYRGFMELKAKTMSVLMLSPLMHNMVIFGRAVPAGKMVGGVPVVGNAISTARMYWDGNKVRGDMGLMREAIGNGLVPMGARGADFDISSIAGTKQIEAGRSWTSRVLAFVPELFDRRAGEAVKRGVDKAGDFWHEKMLWDRVADLQAGIYKNYMDYLIETRGFDRLTASRTAAHFANRYAGAIPHEAISQGMRQILNVGLFSRSYTMTGVGAVKDLFTGLPRDVLAQIERDGGVQELARAQSFAQRKALAIVAMDFALLYVGNSLLQSGIGVLRKTWGSEDNKVSDAIKEEGAGYVDRTERWIKSLPDHPFHVFTPWEYISATAENEPGKTDRILTGYQSDGTAIYMKNPFGKTTEDIAGWMTKPAQMIINKSNPLGTRPLAESFFNQDYAGRHIYNPYAELPEKATRGMANVVLHTLAAAVPTDVGAAAFELLAGTPTKDEATVDVLKIAGPLLGFSFSKGYPGGPVMGEVAMGQKEYQYALEQTLPQARKLAKEDRIGEARELMSKANIPDRFQSYIIDLARNPSAKFAKRRTQQFIQTLPQDRQEAIQRALERYQTERGTQP